MYIRQNGYVPIPYPENYHLRPINGIKGKKRDRTNEQINNLLDNLHIMCEW